MSHQLFRRDFQIEANIPQGIFEAFMVAQTKLLGLRGDLEKNAEGFKGFLEGEKEALEKLKNLIEKADQFVAKIKSIIFSELEEIKQYSTENFNVKN